LAHYGAPGDAGVKLVCQLREIRGRSRAADGSQVLAIPRPGKRLTGKARAIADGVLEFVPEGNTERFYVPLDAVVKIEANHV
jgi:hypothetical protein